MPDTNDLDNNNTETEGKNTSPTHSNKSQSSSPSPTALLVIDDSSNSEEETITNQANNIPTKPQPTTNSQPSHLHQAPRQNSINHVIEQQRRRNSSIAKLLGGQPLHNQQYEEINQQIIDDQTAQNTINNHESGNDSAIQRTRSSITRTLLMNSDRTNSMTKKLPPIPPYMKTSSGPSYPKDFEYLIHGEIDHDHASSVNQRTNSAPKIYSNLNSSNNLLAQSLNTMKLKRKRPIHKPPSNAPPFALHDPFELQSSSSTAVVANNSMPSTNHSPSKYVHFESSKRPCHSNHQSYHLTMDNSSSPSHKANHQNSSPYSQFCIREDPIPTTNCSSPSYHYGHTSDPKESTSMTTHVSTSPTDDSSKSARKLKSILVQPDVDEHPRQRSYSNLSESSSSTTIPLKKRLLDAYNNEQ